jgi:hypothetical protein
LLTRMARALKACEPVGELTWGELTLACSPALGTDDLCAFGRSAGLPGRRATRPRPSGRTPGSSPDWRRVSRSSGSLNGSRRTRSQKAGDGYPGRHVVSWAGQVVGAGSREDSLEFGVLRKVGSIDPDGPVRTLLPALESGWHGRSTRIPAAQPGKGSSGESRLGRAKQAEAPAQVM